MSNLGLERYLRARPFTARTAVGDRYVLALCASIGASTSAGAVRPYHPLRFRHHRDGPWRRCSCSPWSSAWTVRSPRSATVRAAAADPEERPPASRATLKGEAGRQRHRGGHQAAKARAGGSSSAPPARSRSSASWRRGTTATPCCARGRRHVVDAVVLSRPGDCAAAPWPPCTGS